MITSYSNALPLDINENDMPTLSDTNKLDSFNEPNLSKKSSKKSTNKKKNNLKLISDDISENKIFI